MQQPYLKDEIRLGGLRLPVHRWPSEESHPKKKFADARLPFENKKCLDMVLDEFELPKDYPLDFYHRQDIPLRLTITGRKGEQRLGVTHETLKLFILRLNTVAKFELQHRPTDHGLSADDKLSTSSN